VPVRGKVSALSRGLCAEISPLDVLRSEILVQAEARPPSSGNCGTVPILSPHQNNFATVVDVEVWDARPPTGRDLWQQASENPQRRR
jgi:hypothetical protein